MRRARTDPTEASAFVRTISERCPLQGLAVALGLLAAWHLSGTAAARVVERDVGGPRVREQRDLSRGALAFNANKSVYVSNQTAYFQIGVVDGQGRTICDADLELTLETPNGDRETLSTANQRITRNPECGPDNVIDSPDYFASYMPRGPGTYEVSLTARTSDVLHQTQDRFEVRETVPLDIERIGPTRIYPVADYTMTLRIEANEASRGALHEYVPHSFDIRSQRLRIKRDGSSELHSIQRPFSSREAGDGWKSLTWDDVALSSGDELEVTYTFNAPNTSPELYRLGGASLNELVENRQWQIAVDAVAVYDTFTEVADTIITSHLPDTGISWVTAFDDSGGAPAEVSETTDIFHANQTTNDVGQAYSAQPAPTTTDQNVTITLDVLDTTSSNRTIGVFARRTDNNNFYHVQLLPNSHASPSVTLYKYEAGSATALGTFDATLAVGTVIKLEVRDATKRVYVDGIERISSSDNALTAAGTWGLYVGNFNGAGAGGDIRGTWKITDFLAEDGALASVDVYRSVGVTAAALESGTTNAMTISGSTATFASGLADNVGVGDAIQYDSDGNSTIDAIAFIHGRTSSTELTVKNASGGAPTAVAGDNDWELFRSYTTLSNWESLTENANINATVRDFDTSTDLVAQNVDVNVSCYADGPMNDMVDITGWTTGPDNYIRIFTPTSSLEVGASQRHDGTEGTGFRLTPTASGASYQIINIDTGYVRIEGLEIDGSGVTNALFVRGIRVRDGLVNVGDIRIDSNVIHDLHTTQNGYMFEGSMGIIGYQGANFQGPPMRVSNNIIYDVTNNVNVGHIAGILIGSRATSYVYNNTVYSINNTGNACAPDCGPAWGIYSKAFGGGTVDVIATNNYCGSVSAVNPVQRCYHTQSGSGLTQSYNVSSDATAAGTGSQTNQIAYATYFVDVTPGSEDLHLRDSSVNLWGSNGFDLSGGANLSVSVDIDGESRARPDIGADEHVATRLYRSVGVTATALATGAANALTIAGSTATFATGLADNVGVGDAIEYDSDGNTTIDAIAFIHGRTSSTQYAVKDAAGSAPPAVAGDNDWSLFRAYTRLSNWESQTENTNINGTVRNFDTSTDLVTPNTLMIAAAYADGADTTAVVLNGWVTGPGNYIKIYTPRNPDEVGTSQRHNGAWDTSAYRLEVGGATVLEIGDEYVRIDGLQLRLTTDTLNVEGIGITGAGPVSYYEISNNIVRGNGVGAVDTRLGINLWSCGSGVMKAWNNVVYDFAGGSSNVAGIAPDDAEFTFYLYNNTVTDSRRGITNYAGTVVVKNNLSYMNFDNWNGTFAPASTNNLSGPGADPQMPAANARDGVAVTFVNYAGDDFHLASGDTGAQDFGVDLSTDPKLGFAMDIDHAGRRSPWDIGADDVLATTAVELVSFAARAGDGAAELSWVTGSELNNLGFHLYRSLSEEGPYERITASLIPGLGSSPQGASYTYRDSGLINGVTYYYELEDIETTGSTEIHGPVPATPQTGWPFDDDDTRPSEGDAVSLVTYGDPSASTLRVLTRTRRQVVLELLTEGFYAEALDDGTVRLRVPGFESLIASEGPDTPVKRTWVEAVSGRQVELMSVRARDVEVFSSLHLASVDLPDVVATPEGTVRAARRRARKAFASAGAGLSPESAARIVSVGFQDEVKKALVELAPLRWDATRGELLLARRLVVRLAFQGREPSELAPGRGYTKRPSHDTRRVIAQLATQQPGLHAVRYEDVMRARRGVRARTLRLSRQGETVAYHLAPNPNRFAPGSVLYFISDGAAANPFGAEAVYELELGVAGDPMAIVSSIADGPSQPVYWHRQEWEQDRYYQAALVDAPDLWLWDLLNAPELKSYPLEVSGFVSSADASKLSVWLQGVSDFPAEPDHHVRVYVNGALMEDVSWDGKQPQQLDIDLAPGVLRESGNVLELDNVGDTEAAYSMVMLDRYALEYPRAAAANDGRLRGRWSDSGTAELAGFASDVYVLDTGGAAPLWLVDTDLGGDGLLRFRAEAGHSYLAVSPDAVARPTVRTPRASRLKNKRNRADYVLIAPELFLEATQPLLELRRAQGLRVRAVSIEEIYSEFGFGETTPEALKDFLSYAYHQWRQPSPRYVVLVGDATYDFKDRLQTGVTNQVPPRMVKTSYLWTASDPSYAAVNGEDLLPDFAIGRLPAATVDEVEAMVSKIVAYETGDAGIDRASVVLVADNPDGAGNFEADANALAAGVLASKAPTQLYLSQLGTAGTREAIARNFDDGASLVSYIGHGGIHLWADENVFNAAAVGSLDVQSQQPLLLTMNCLNGYFHFPYFDSLAEALVKAPGKGAIAAFSPSGLSLNGPASVFHQALLEELFNGNHSRLGDAVLAAQKSYADSGAFPELLSIYHLLGDPALTLR